MLVETNIQAMQAAAVIVRKPIRPPTRSLTLLFSNAIIRWPVDTQ
jgi:hypothetical protein